MFLGTCPKRLGLNAGLHKVGKNINSVVRKSFFLPNLLLSLIPARYQCHVETKLYNN